ncbi:energy transducer TonB [Sphingorhabdus arenilitoris]|uniref:Energy transducer TonB n=1 Tax=Sphingorhabdus arenilitoris TaxID=1490041 RepID=A0ABV8RG90_9SPHN
MSKYILRLAATLTGLAIVTSPALAAKAPLVLEPSLKWIVDYKDEGCRLVRTFGPKDNEVMFVASRYAPGDTFKLTIAGKPVKLSSAQKPVHFQFGPTEADQEKGFFIGELGKGNPAIIVAGGMLIGPLPGPKIDTYRSSNDGSPQTEKAFPSDRYAAVQQLVIGKPLRQSVILRTGPLDKAFAAMDQCIDNLITYWGIDPEKHRTLTRYAVPASNPGNWVRADDYPRDMLFSGQAAIVEFRLNVGSDGQPSACNIQATTRPKEFDDAVCKSLMKRASFEPALDSAGQPMNSFWTNTVIFQLPGLQP